MPTRHTAAREARRHRSAPRRRLHNSPESGVGSQPLDGAARWAAVAELAARQWGVVDDAGLAGARRQRVRRCTGRSRSRGCGGSRRRLRGGRCSAARARDAGWRPSSRSGRARSLSYRSAAAHWDLRRPRSAASEVTAPRRGRRQPPGSWCTSPVAWRAAEVTTHRGIPITTVVAHARRPRRGRAAARPRRGRSSAPRSCSCSMCRRCWWRARAPPAGAAVRRVLDAWAPVADAE